LENSVSKLVQYPCERRLLCGRKKATSRTPDGKSPGESKSSPREIQNYLGRISGPLLDRIDLHVEVPQVKFLEISGDRTGETSAQIRERFVAARQRQHERFKNRPKITCNARIRAFDICTTLNSRFKRQKIKAFLPPQAVSARNQDHWRFAHGEAETGRIIA
jgi:predicted ATPase with chaperone activity